MSTVRRRLTFPLLLAIATFAASCDSTPTGPGTGTGTLLEATIDGTAISFTLTQGFQTYEEAETLGRFGGFSGTSHVMTATFVSDITTGTFPRTLADDLVTITLVVTTSGIATTYYCTTDPDNCEIVLTAHGNGIVDGTFSAHLTNRDDANDHVEITNGRFSVKLE